MIRVTVWNEYEHERTIPEIEKVYPDELHLTYSEDFFDYGHACYPCNIVETDELYALTYICGGEYCCYAVFKNEPDAIYDCAYNQYIGDLKGSGIELVARPHR